MPDIRGVGATAKQTFADEPTSGEVLGALSHALDLVEGQPQGHAERTWMIASRIARELRLPESDHEALFFACMLKDSGCSTNSARIHQVFGGDETIAKRNVKFADWSNPVAAILYGIRSAFPGGTWAEKLHQLSKMVKQPPGLMDEVTRQRCSRGADIARYVGFGEACASTIRNLDEHWDGRGSPDKLSETAIPLLARIACVAQTVEVFASVHGVASAYAVLRRRNRTWFDPEIVRVVRSFRHDRAFWTEYRLHANGEAVSTSPPTAALVRRAADTDRICQAFATVIDAKSTFTGEHSSRVASYAVGIGSLVELPAIDLLNLQRAGLLHDIGKLAVPNSILDKPGRLDESEFARIKEHPRHSYEVLKRVPAFSQVASLAANHHERLDGRGYWRGLRAEDLDLASRCLTAADVYDALTAERPYRGPMSHEEAMAVMWREEAAAFDPRCLEALEALNQRVPRSKLAA